MLLGRVFVTSEKHICEKSDRFFIVQFDGESPTEQIGYPICKTRGRYDPLNGEILFVSDPCFLGDLFYDYDFEIISSDGFHFRPDALHLGSLVLCAASGPWARSLPLKNVVVSPLARVAGLFPF